MHWIHLFTLCGKGGERKGRLIIVEADHPAVPLVGLNDCLPIPEGGHGIGWGAHCRERQWLQLQTAGNFISNRLCRWCCEYQLRAARVMRAMPRVKMQLGVGRV